MNSRAFCRLLSALVVGGLSFSGYAQSGKASLPAEGDSAAANRASADAEWARLKELGRREPAGAVNAADAAAISRARHQFVTDLIRDADQLGEFRSKYSDHPQVAEARRLEALSLVKAWGAGDISQRSRRERFVLEVRRDASLSPAQRSRVAAHADHVAVGQRQDLTRDGKLLEYEKVNRALIREFPGVPDGHEALLQIARDSSDAKAHSLARELAQTAAAPEWVRAEALSLASRHDLVGKSFPELAQPVLGPANVVERAQRKPMIVYSWATFAPRSIALAKRIATEAPPGVAVIGLNLDVRDLAPAKALAQAQRLPGDHIYDWMGRKGELAERIHLLDPGIVYLVGSDGLIRSVSGQRDLPAAWAQLAKP